MHKRRFNLPPLDLIQGFEAAARNLSFTKAADELLITQSAVSRQIRALEEHLGVALFERRPRTLVLTEHGARCSGPPPSCSSACSRSPTVSRPSAALRN